MAGEDTPAEAGNGGKPEATREGSSGRANRNRNRRPNRNNTSNTGMPKVEAFVGRVEVLKGFIYGCSDNKQAEMYTKTTEEISRYVGREFRSGSDDVRRAVDALQLPIIAKPPPPASTATRYEEKEWDGLIKVYQQRTANLEEGMKRLYNVVYGQCSPAMIQRLHAIDGFEEDIIFKSDALGLLTAIKGICFNFQSLKFVPHAIQPRRALAILCIPPGTEHDVFGIFEGVHQQHGRGRFCGGTIGVSPAELEISDA
jgi:hypothetical protein